MNRRIASWLISILAGVVVGGAGGFLVLQALGSGPSDEDSRAGRSGFEALEEPVSQDTSGRLGFDAVSGEVPPYAAASGSSAEFQEEVRRAINQALGEGRRTAIVNATERVHGAVVTVFVIERIRVRSLFGSLLDDFLSFGTPGREYPHRGLGSGVIISEDGYILTNDHVVGNADNITVRLADGREFEGVVIDTDPRLDLAILKIDPQEDLPIAELGDSSDIMIGEWVIALGNPFGFMLQDPQPSVSVGVVSAVGRSFITVSEGKARYFPSTIQTDAAINPGNSGGPLVNTLGEVVGINSFILSQSGESVGIGFAIPINQAKKALDQVRIFGHIRRAWTGLLRTDDNSWYYVNQGVRNERGIVLLDVEPESPAELAGLIQGALIVGVNEREVRRNQELEAILLKAEIGDTIQIEYYPYRSNRKRTTVLTVDEEPRGK